MPLHSCLGDRARPCLPKTSKTKKKKKKLLSLLLKKSVNPALNSSSHLVCFIVTASQKVAVILIRIIFLGRARWLKPVIPALWEAERVDHEVKRSRPSWSTCKFIYLFIYLLKINKWNYHIPNNLTTGYIRKGNKISVLKRYLHPHVYCSTTQNCQDIDST